MLSPSLFIILDPLRVVCVTDCPCESLPFGSVVHGWKPLISDMTAFQSTFAGVLEAKLRSAYRVRTMSQLMVQELLYWPIIVRVLTNADGSLLTSPPCLQCRHVATPLHCLSDLMFKIRHRWCCCIARSCMISCWYRVQVSFPYIRRGIRHWLYTVTLVEAVRSCELKTLFHSRPKAHDIAWIRDASSSFIEQSLLT